MKILTAKLHIVSFEVPFPANYGGVIDVFYKIKALHALDVEIYLHCFYTTRAEAKILENYCKKVYYYKRNSLFVSLFSKLPVLVKSRANKLLIRRLKELNAPILFEGLHTAYPLVQNHFLQNTFVRAHNIEHDYYEGLANSENSFWKKLFYKSEAKKLAHFEDVYKKTTGILSISPYEQDYFYKKYGEKAQYLPVFHEATKSQELSGKKHKIAYHGDLRISDNIKAANFIIDIYANGPYELLIGGNEIPNKMKNRINNTNNVRFIDISEPENLKILFKEAQIHILVTFQKTGIKLKLLNSLYKGRHIIANSPMIEDTSLENLCTLANSKEEFLTATKKLIYQEFSEDIKKLRMDALTPFDPQTNAVKLKKILFK